MSQVIQTLQATIFIQCTDCSGYVFVSQKYFESVYLRNITLRHWFRPHFMKYILSQESFIEVELARVYKTSVIQICGESLAQ